jgi:hypothetical protein
MHGRIVGNAFGDGRLASFHALPIGDIVAVLADEDKIGSVRVVSLKTQLDQYVKREHLEPVA